MFQTIRNAFKLPDLRRKLLFTVLILVLYRIGAAIPVPYVDTDTLQTIVKGTAGSLIQYLNIMSGDAFSKATLFALSINPYITASIVMQLLTIAIPALEKLNKQGEEGRKKITQITRYVTCGLGLVTAYGYYAYMSANNIIVTTGSNRIFAAIVVIACYSAGAALIMWLAEKINEFGIGNGISLILFVNIVASGPQIVQMLASYCQQGVWGVVITELIVVVALAIVVFMVFVTNSERRLPVQYAKKVVGRKMYGGQSSNLPIKLNMSGVMPIIFASSICSIPATLQLIFPAKEGTFWAGFYNFFGSGSWFYAVLMFVLIIAFAYFYIAISFNPIEVSNNLKKNGGFIPGIRPGKPTVDYITKILGRITFIGALFLGFIAVFPIIVNICSGSALGSIAFGGSSMLIVVGVALETANELEAQMTMRHYKGFLE